jgi:hypothetical protein
MKFVSFAALLLLAAPAPIFAQQQPRTVGGLPEESVTVVGVKPSEETIGDFVANRVSPSRTLGKVARWKAEVCPLTVGLRADYAKYISRRIREVASAVGAPVNADPGCRPNIEVVFTTTPQDLMDNVRKKQPLFIGYFQNLNQADRLAKVTHPVQAWYTTQTVDFYKNKVIDTGRCGLGGTDSLTPMTSPSTMEVSDIFTAPGVKAPSLPCATVAHVSRSRVNNGLNTAFYNVLVVAEPAKLLDYEIGGLADYIAMLALSQPASLDRCQELPSISNMLAPGCASVPDRITDGDLAYLRALYGTVDGSAFVTQRNYMRAQMYKTLVTDKGGPG